MNAGYACWLMWKNKTLGLLVSQGGRQYWLWAAFMGLAWPLGIVLYGMGADRMGAYGAFVAFPMMLVTAILFGNFAGAVSGEWKGTSRRTRIVMVRGVAVLGGAFAVLGLANKRLSAMPNEPEPPAARVAASKTVAKDLCRGRFTCNIGDSHSTPVTPVGVAFAKPDSSWRPGAAEHSEHA